MSGSGATVVLVPLENVANRMLYRRVVASGAGSFSISGVVPGSYRLLAFENLPETAEFDRRFMEAFRARGTEITALAGQTAAVELTVISR